jgi:hypothetical protein
MGKSGAMLLTWGLAISLVLLTACKNTTEAVAAARQLNAVSTNLLSYYDDLSTQLNDTILLNQVQSAMDKVPFGNEDRAQIIDVKSEIGKRAAMARSLSTLARAYGKLASSAADADASTAASTLANELSTAKALPSGSAIPDVAGAAAKLLVDFVQTRSLKKGSRGIEKAVTAISEIFDDEKKAYESIQKQRLALAQQISNELIDKREIEIDFGTLGKARHQTVFVGSEG